jgi:hypothetical protein
MTNTNQTQKQDDLLREGRRDDERISPFEQVQQKIDNEQELNEDAEAEQQHKEAMTERD